MKLLFRFILLLLIQTSVLSGQDPRSTDQREGLRENRPKYYALSNATVVVSPGDTRKQVTVVIHNGKIESILSDAGKIPPAAKRIDLQGKTLYAAFIDSYSAVEIPAEQFEQGAGHWNPHIRPQVSAADVFKVDTTLNQSLRKQGIATRLLVPSGGIFKGSSALVSTADTTVPQATLKKNIAQHGVLTVPRRWSSTTKRPAYPNSPMGAVALARQTLLDAQWYQLANETVRADPSIPAPTQNDSLSALSHVIGRRQTLILDSSNELYFLRADRFAREFNLKTIIKGSGFEFRRLDEIAQTGRSIILPVNFPTAPNVASFETALNVSLETLMEWDHAPENPAKLSQAGVEFAFCSEGLAKPSDFLPNLRKAVARGLSHEKALAALTTTPARMWGVEKLLGSIERGKLANFVVTNGNLFDPETRIVETWVSGIRYLNEKKIPRDLSGDWKLVSKGPKGKPLTYKINLALKENSLSGTVEPWLKEKPQSKRQPNKPKPKKTKKPSDPQNPSIKLSKAGIQNNRFSATFDSRKLGGEGISRITFVLEDSTTTAAGHLVHASGLRVAASLTRIQAVEPKTPDAKKDPKPNPAKSQQKDPQENNKATYAVNFPLGAYGRQQVPDMERVLVSNVTIWTCSDKGIIQNGSVLVENGKITAVGTEINVADSQDLVTVDGKGMHLTPGIIDCHSHMASDGGINESGQAITAEVRIGDFINCNDISIYRHLAGGVTTSNILHGSANPIGGQNQVIKLRWGMNGEALKFSEAPQGIKFALGENVKRSRSKDSTRYPKTRMGVEQIFMDEFRAAKGYQQAWKNWERDRAGLPPRRDLELDAIVEILNQKRWIHCHSYRQDEILALIRLLDGFNIRIGTFQHILEGYKVADAMKKHGAMGSAFADWWAYKFEVYDAIPYAGALMHNAGVVVSFNSDDRELGRHLNHEAAKAVKYGGVSPQEALKFVTLNPAKQLRIERYVGSIETGKHADLVLWNGDPLSTLSRCEKTWVDGRRMFDRQQDLKQRTMYEKMKQSLIQKVLGSGEKMNSLPNGRPPKAAEMWPNYDEFCKCKGKQ